MKRSISIISLSIMLLFSTTLTSCLGSFAAFNGLKDWNQDVSDNKFVNQLLFWVLNIVPVYELFFIGDIIIFNLIEFWSGSNPLAMVEGEIEKQDITYMGKTYRMTAMKNKMMLTNTNGEIVSELNFDTSTNTWWLTHNDQTQRVISLDNLQGNLASYKLYSDCTEGQILTVNTSAIDEKYSLHY